MLTADAALQAPATGMPQVAGNQVTSPYPPPLGGHRPPGAPMQGALPGPIVPRPAGRGSPSMSSQQMQNILTAGAPPLLDTQPLPCSRC